MPHQVINIPFGDQLIGQGYNSNTGEAIGTALDVGMIKEDPTVDGGKAVTTFELVATQDSLLETLGISASVDLRIGLFSGGAKMSFAEDHAVNSFSTYVVGRSSIQNAVRHGIGFRLTAPAQALVDAGRMPEFKQAFGDRFVRSFLTGGEFCVVARITSVSEEHQVHWLLRCTARTMVLPLAVIFPRLSIKPSARRTAEQMCPLRCFNPGQRVSAGLYRAERRRRHRSLKEIAGFYQRTRHRRSD